MPSTAALSAPAQPVFTPEAVAPGPISLVRVAKHPTDRSFGMSLEQRRGISPLGYTAVVSYIFPDSPAARAGIQRDIEFEIRSYDCSAQVVPPTANLNPLASVANDNGAPSGHCASSGFTDSSVPRQQSSPALPVSPPAFLLTALSSGPLLLSPMLAPPIATSGTASFTPGRVISSPGSSLGVAAPMTSAPTPAPARPRTLAAPTLPTLNGSQSQASIEQVNGESNPQQAQTKPTTPTIIHPAPLPPAIVHPAQVVSSVAVPNAALTTTIVGSTTPIQPLPQQQATTISNNSDSKLDGTKMSSAKPSVAPETTTTTSAKPVGASQPSVPSPTPVKAARSSKQSVVSPKETTTATQKQSAPPVQAEVIPRPKVEPVVASPTQPPSVVASQVSNSIKPPASSVASPSTGTPRPSHSGKKRARPRGLSASSASSSTSSDEKIAKALSHGSAITPRNRNTIANESDDDSDHPAAHRARSSVAV
uniref:PDZ domain-containing protein n=1 Tax=Globisporangium ultimum (strain ATCC 200006 / CBS 805.95 / DAOM BR144) TaxID=431595 RepID=K3X1Y6_GLOUD